jgi:bifunctional non-homologous end joining protein LigD
VARLPDRIKPMKAVSSAELPLGEGWGYEIKWDGMRLIAFVDPEATPAVRLQSTNLRDVTASFPELAGLAEATCDKPAVLDGEAVAFTDDGRPSFGRLQQRMHLTNPADVALRMAEVPVVYQAFDLLQFDGHDTTTLSYVDRHRLLEEVLEPGPWWKVSTTHVEDGEALYEAATERGLEGLMAKRLESPYEPGKRSPNWRKVKIRPQQEFVVGGWLPGEGNRAGRLGSLLVGYYDDDELRYAGRVGTGFTEAELTRLEGVLAGIAADETPFVPTPPRDVVRHARWVRPEIVAEVAFGEWTGDGRLRHPAYLGQRDDKSPRQVVREPL